MKPHVVIVVVVLPVVWAGLCSGCATYTPHPAQPVHAAAEEGDLAGVRAAVALDPRCIEAKGVSGCRPLHIAAEKGQAAVVGYLLEQGATPDARDWLSWTPLHRAAYGGQVETARLLLDAGARKDARDGQGFTPLHWAVYESVSSSGAADTARLLVARGARVNARDKEGSTPLFWAGWQGNKDLVVFLLEHGADQRLRGKEGLTPLESAEEYGNSEIAAVLENRARADGIAHELVKRREILQRRRAASASQAGSNKRPSAVEIRETSVEEWFRVLGSDTRFGYAPFSALNALIAKAKAAPDTKEDVIHRAAECVDDQRAEEIKRWQCCYILSGTRDGRGMPALTRALRDRSDLVRGVAACALGAFDNEEATSALKAAARTERSRDVAGYIQKSLKGEYRKRAGEGEGSQGDGA